MCGIAGLVGAEPGYPVEHATVQRMCGTIVHRGPDEEGLYVQDGVGLGMRRLSIIDLVSGRQPIHNEDRSVWIVFNGEIYNFPELRGELESRGHRFYTSSDTEVIVHLYEDLGADCVSRLRGMFAFALYDFRKRRLLLARDRLGKKPLHYAWTGQALLFGSEIKALLAVAPELAEVDQEHLLSFFYFGYIPDPHSAFRRIRKLPPGHLLEFAGGKFEVRRYWDLPAYGSHPACSEGECLEEMEQRLSEAVRIRLISDVPLGALLSGGVDSSTVVALMARASAGPVKTFSIGFRHQDFDEAPYARAVAERFGTEHHELIVDPDLGEAIQHLTGMIEEPFSDSSMLPTYFVCRMARQHVTVALAGDGGDELFAGYDRYATHLRRRFANAIPGWAGRLFREHLYPRLPEGLLGRQWLYNNTLPEAERYLDTVSRLPVRGRESGLFSAEFLAWARSRPSPFDLLRPFFDAAPARDPLARLLYLDTKTYLPYDVLTKVDRMSMATSLEVRAPLLDHVFVEWAATLPAQWKRRNGRPKYLLRKLAERLGVPRPVLERPKRGFSMPMTHWLRDQRMDDLLGILREPRTLERGYFSRRGLESLLDEHLRGRRNWASAIWLLLVFELWHRNFLEGTLAQPLGQGFARGSITVRGAADVWPVSKPGAAREAPPTPTQ